MDKSGNIYACSAFSLSVCCTLAALIYMLPLSSPAYALTDVYTTRLRDNDHLIWTPDGSPYIIHNRVVVYAETPDDPSVCPVLEIGTQRADGSRGTVELTFKADARIIIGAEGRLHSELLISEGTHGRIQSFIAAKPLKRNAIRRALIKWWNST